MDHVEYLLQAQGFQIAGQVAGPPSTLAVIGVGAARPGHEQHRAEGIVLLPRRIGRAQTDGAGGRRKGRGHQVAADADHLAVLVHQGARGTQDLPRLVQQDADAQFLKHPQGAVMDRLYPVR